MVASAAFDQGYCARERRTVAGAKLLRHFCNERVADGHRRTLSPRLVLATTRPARMPRSFGAGSGAARPILAISMAEEPARFHPPGASPAERKPALGPRRRPTAVMLDKDNNAMIAAAQRFAQGLKRAQA